MKSEFNYQNDTSKPSLIINATSNYIALGINIAIGFFLTPYIIKYLGTENYGIWTLIASLVGYYGLLDLGVTSAVMRYIARYVSSENTENLNKIVNTAMVIFCSIGVVVIVLSIFLADPLANFFHLSGTNSVKFKQLIWIMGVTTGLVFPGSALITIILAHERFVIGNTIRIIGTVLKGGLTFIILHNSGGLVGIGWANLIARIFIIIACVILLKSRFKHVVFAFPYVEKKWIKKLISFGFFSFLIRVGNLLRLKLHKVVIGKYINMEYVGVYSIASILIEYIYQLMRACVGVTQPRLSSIAANNDIHVLARGYKKYSVIVSVLAMGIGLVGLMLGEDFIKLWVPSNFKDPMGATIVFTILIIGLLPDLMTLTTVNALQAIKKHHYLAFQTIMEGGINLILSIILIQRMGIYGVALATAIPSIISKLIVQPIYTCKIFYISWWRYMLNILLKPLFTAGVIYFTLDYSNLLFKAESYTLLFLNGLIVISIYVIAAYLVCLDKKTKQIVKNKVMNFILKKKKNV